MKHYKRLICIAAVAAAVMSTLFCVNVFADNKAASQKAKDMAIENAATLEDGFYTIKSAKNKAYVLDVCGGSKSNGANIQLYASNNSNAQAWKIEHDEDGFVIISNYGSGLSLDIAGGKTDNLTNVWQYKKNSTIAQKWILVPDEKGIKIVAAADTKKVLDLYGAKIANQTNIDIYSSNDTLAQRWIFTPYKIERQKLDELAKANEETLPDGKYFIKSAKDTSGLMTVQNNSESLKGNVNIAVLTGSKSQGWEVSHDENGYITIKNMFSGYVLDAAGAKAENGTNIWQYSSNDSYAQKWIAVKDASGIKLVSAINSKYVLDVCGGNTVNGNIQLYSSNNSKAQRWVFDVFEYTKNKIEMLAEENADVIPDGKYVITSAKKNSCVLDVYGAGTDSGINVQLYAGNTTKAQAWSITHDEEGFVTITNLNSGKVLDVYGGKAVGGGNVWQYSSNGSRAQKWVITQETNGYKIVSALDINYVLDLYGGKVNNGTNIQIYKSNNTAAQRWNFEKPEYFTESSDVMIIGDSRTVGIKGTVFTDAEYCASTYKKLDYMESVAMPKAVESGKKYIVIQFGVNDLNNGDEELYARRYAELINKFAAENPDRMVYFTSVAPTDGKYVWMSSSISEFNRAIEPLLNGVKYINLYGNVNFTTRDGLHYIASTYVSWYKYVMRVVKYDMENPDAVIKPTPTPEVTPTPTPEVTPEVTPEPTPEPDTEPTPEVTPNPDAASTPVPTPEVTPETTPVPTPVPTPEVMPVPTPLPTAEPTQGI